MARIRFAKNDRTLLIGNGDGNRSFGGVISLPLVIQASEHCHCRHIELADRKHLSTSDCIMTCIAFRQTIAQSSKGRQIAQSRRGCKKCTKIMPNGQMPFLTNSKLNR
jgi:hypothetical protein